MLAALVLGQVGCGGGSSGGGTGGGGGPVEPVASGYCQNAPAVGCSAATPCPAGDGPCLQGPTLQADEVLAIMQSAARAIDQELVVAVTDRRGVILGVATNFAFDYDAACNQGPCPAVETGCPTEPTAVSDCRAVDLAVQLARTAAFFGANQTPLTSRSIRFLSGEHFPPGIQNAAAAALFGIENTNRGCTFDTGVPDPLLATLIPRAVSLPAVLRQRAGAAPLRCQSAEVDDPAARCGCTTGIATIPGAVPIFKKSGGAASADPARNGMAGGVGVVIRAVEIQCDRIAAFDSTSILRLEDTNRSFNLMEFAARAYAGDHTGLPQVAPRGLDPLCANPLVPAPACCGADPPCDFNILPLPAQGRALPFDPVIFIDGIEVPEVATNPSVPAGAGTFAPATNFIVDPSTLNPADPLDSARPLPVGWLIGPMDATDAPPGVPPLSAPDVSDIVMAAFDDANRVRAAIRLPLPARSKMTLAVADTNDVLLGVFRMDDATVFSIDVATAKARNVAYFSSPDVDALDRMDCPGQMDPDGAPVGAPLCLARDAIPDRPDTGTSITNRTLSFSAQPFFPSGIEGSLPPFFPPPFAPGPFRYTFIYDSAYTCTNGQEPPNGRQNGIVFFPGSAPLYRDRDVLVGGLGVSGDGVEQDDRVTFSGTRSAPGFEPQARIRADQLRVRDVRLPYLKFNRQPFK